MEKKTGLVNEIMEAVRKNMTVDELSQLVDNSTATPEVREEITLLIDDLNLAFVNLMNGAKALDK